MGLQNSDRIQRRYKGYIAPPGEQARPIGGFYAGTSAPNPPLHYFILNHTNTLPLEMLKKHPSPLTATLPTTPPPSSDSLPKSQKEQTLEKARIVFGSKLAGPAERTKEIEAASKVIAGVIVPPKPDEPDNCCMSGCVNCVWDLYRDEMEGWAEKSRMARQAQAQERNKGEGKREVLAGSGNGSRVPLHVATSVDDDGGGSESNWNVGADDSESDLFEGVPVGIREFMRTEKKLKMMQKEQQKRKETPAAA